MKVKNMLIQILNIYRLFLVWLMVLLDNKKELILMKLITGIHIHKYTKKEI
ncbi:unknown [Blautia hydrogenotrophica CAG:147]|nr:unknown [Blautia hydrogenotrophica CAG:147]